MTEALLGFAILIALCFFGFRVGFATLLVGFLGFAWERGWSAAVAMTGQQVTHEALNYNLTVIPLFVLMGVFIYRSEVSRELFDAAYVLVRRLRGGLAHATVLACGGFSAVCGSTLATAATMSKVAMPAMKSYNYDDRIASGTIAAGGTLGIMIPPSVPLVIYGIISREDIGTLFIAGIVPGLLLICLFLVSIAITVRLDKRLVPVDGGRDNIESSQGEAGKKGGVLAVLVLFVVILGGIYSGLCTATEASGIGAVGAAFIAFLRGHLRTLSDWKFCLADATLTTGKLLIVLIGALVFSQFINLSGLPFALVRFVFDHSFDAWQLVLFIVAIALVMGMVFETIGILVLLVPVFIPALQQLNVNLIWFGIIIVIVAEIGLITPPIGMNVFVVKSVLRDVRLSSIFMGVMPFILALASGLILTLLFPAIATFLPDLMR